MCVEASALRQLVPSESYTFDKRLNMKKVIKQVLFTGFLFAAFVGCATEPQQQTELAIVEEEQPEEVVVEANTSVNGPDTATLGAGCFWCVEAVFQELKGVISIKSGYMGGHVDNPSYKAVCTGTTGHAEVAQIVYDPEVITFAELLQVFWKTHDPTTLNRQGNDVGTQYRSAIFYHNDEQRKQAEHYKKEVDESEAYPAPLVTEISPKTTFYVAEDYHQNYYNDNPNQGYCTYVIQPKVEKFRKAFASKLKN